MSGIIIGLILIIAAFTFNIILSVFHIKRPIGTFTLVYCLGILLLGVALTWLNYAGLSRGELLTIPLCAIGAVIRVSVYYFRTRPPHAV